MLVQFRYSETDFVAYLVAIGYKIIKIETTFSKTSGKRTFAFIEGEQDKLISLYEEYKNGFLDVNVSDFIKARRYVSKQMKKSYSSLGWGQ